MTTLESWRIIVENEHNDVQKILDDWENEQQAALLTEKELDDKITALVAALKGDVIKLANLASMVDENQTKEYMTTVYAALAQVGE